MIKVGAATEVELKEKKHRIEDALSTTRAAVEEGLVAGGGTTLLQAIHALDKVKLDGDAPSASTSSARPSRRPPGRSRTTPAPRVRSSSSTSRASRPARATTP